MESPLSEQKILTPEEARKLVDGRKESYLQIIMTAIQMQSKLGFYDVLIHVEDEGRFYAALDKLKEMGYEVKKFGPMQELVGISWHDKATQLQEISNEVESEEEPPDTIVPLSEVYEQETGKFRSFIILFTGGWLSHDAGLKAVADNAVRQYIQQQKQNEHNTTKQSLATDSTSS